MKFKENWINLENIKNPPTRVNKIFTEDYDKFKNEIIKEKEIFVKKITKSLYEGDIYILKNAFSENFFNDLKTKCYENFKDVPSSFHKMKQDSPDFHRQIDLDSGKKYSFKVCKHSFYFYHWNNDPLNIFPEIYEKWRVIKKLMGLDMFAYEKNKPLDGVIDRIQVVRYPSKFGHLEPHSDPCRYQRLFLSGYMSKKNNDYNDGGFYVLDKDDKVIDAEKFIDVGDIGIGYATIIHGVAPVNIKKDPDWNDINDGRWFLSMYSNESDEVKNRHTAHAIGDKIKIIDKSIFPPE